MTHEPRRVWKRTFGLSSLLWLTVAITGFLAGRFGHWGKLASAVSGTRLTVPVGETITYAATSPFATFSVATAKQEPFVVSPTSQSEMRITGVSEGGGALILRCSEDEVEVLTIHVVNKQPESTQSQSSVIADPRPKTAGEDAKQEQPTAFKMLIQSSPTSMPYMWFDLTEYVGSTALDDEQWIASAIAEMKNSILQDRWIEKGGPVAATLVSDTELIVAGSDHDHSIIQAYLEGLRDGNVAADD